MRKPDDDLKIDISEIFGGEITPLDSPSEALSKPEAGTETAESDSHYQAFIEERNRILEAKTAEIESRPPSMIASVESETAASPQETERVSLPPDVAEPIPGKPRPEDVVDFNAPMRPPFMGPSQSEGPKTQAEDETEKASLLQKGFSFFLLFEEYRAILTHELKDVVGEKKTRNMLTKTFEMAREKYPEVFRNANWDENGNLLDDGSLNCQKMVSNAWTFDLTKRDITMDMALTFLMSLRFMAIEKGLGMGFKNKIRARLIQWVTEKGESARREGKETAPFPRLKNYLS